MQVRMSSLADVGRNGIEPLQQERIDVRIQLEENPSGQTVRLFVVVVFRFGDAEDTSDKRAEQQCRGVAFLYGEKMSIHSVEFETWLRCPNEICTGQSRASKPAMDWINPRPT